jgi:membrane protein DedA with SNARE-associated domain
MPSVDDTPVIQLFLFFFTVVFIRTQVFYWIARHVSYMSLKRADIKNPRMRRIAESIRRTGEGRGSRTLERWGLPAVFFSFFMTGTKTIVNVAAGLAQMRFFVWLWPMLLGCIAHAIIYATIGWAAWTAALTAAAGSPIGATAILVVVVGIVFYVVRVRGRRRVAAAESAPTASTSTDGSALTDSTAAGVTGVPTSAPTSERSRNSR